MAVVLYGSKSSASFVVHWLLIELGIEHELRMLDLEQGEQKSPAYLALTRRAACRPWWSMGRC